MHVLGLEVLLVSLSAELTFSTALIASKVVALHFVVIYYVRLNTNISHYTPACVSHWAATISILALILLA